MRGQSLWLDRGFRRSRRRPPGGRAACARRTRGARSADTRCVRGAAAIAGRSGHDARAHRARVRSGSEPERQGTVAAVRAARSAPGGARVAAAQPLAGEPDQLAGLAGTPAACACRACAKRCSRASCPTRLARAGPIRRWLRGCTRSCFGSACRAMCRDHDELTDQLLGSMLWHLDLIVDYVDRGDSTEAAIARALTAFAEDWQERCGLLDELEAVFGTTGHVLKNTHWDQLRGLLRSDGWQEVVRIRRLLEALPGLSDVLRRLGRAQPAADEDESRPARSAAGRAVHRVVRARRRHARARDAGRNARRVPVGSHRAHAAVGDHAADAPAPAPACGTRTTPSACLLTYEEDDRMHQSVRDRVPVSRPCPQRKPDRRMEAGPMLICVDTSGSMQGGAEAVAKAVVLEAMRTAHAQHRPATCSPSAARTRSWSSSSIWTRRASSTLVQFLGQGFRGGTDICGPLERVLDRAAAGALATGRPAHRVRRRVRRHAANRARGGAREGGAGPQGAGRADR